MGSMSPSNTTLGTIVGMVETKTSFANIAIMAQKDDLVNGLAKSVTFGHVVHKAFWSKEFVGGPGRKPNLDCVSC